MNKKLTWRLASALLACFLSACGGGGGGGDSGSSSDGTPANLSISGTAATGLAIAGATINAKCQMGTGVATTIADGSYQIAVAGGNFPCLLEITNPVDNSRLHTVVAGGGSSAIANITPLSEMVTARVLLKDPAVFYMAFDAAAINANVTTANLKTAQSDVIAVLSGTLDLSSVGDLISTPLKAATQDNVTGGDVQDKLLDALKAKINSAQLTQIVTALATRPNKTEIKQVLVDMSVAPPTANAGVNQNVLAGAVVTLDGSASSVDKTRSLTYVWSLTTKPAGSSATLSSATSAKPTFSADVQGIYIASLVVSDGIVNSNNATVAIIASSLANAVPVANAGIAQNVVTGTVVALNGTASSDANGDLLTYAWSLTTKPAGSSATLSSATSAKPTFSADLPGIYIASLVVSDGIVNSSNATVAIIVSSVLNAVPVANAGIAQNVVTGTVVALNGTASSDANGDLLTYAWSLTTKPAGSAATLSSVTSARPTFTADLQGVYIASLVVSDGKVNSNTARVAITSSVANAVPVANAGSAQSAYVASTVTLDGAASSDADGDTLTYDWSLVSKPERSSSYFGSNAIKPTFVPDVAGVYVIGLVVRDGKSSSPKATVAITASTGTTIGGIISTDTSLTAANSPYLITSTLQIAYGVTLTIGPGVTVRSTNYSSINVYGVLKVLGTASSPVNLEQLNINKSGTSSSQASTFDISHANINGGSLYAYSGYGKISITDSVLTSVNPYSYIYLWYPTGKCYIERNIFKSSGGLSIGSNSGLNVYVRNNVFSGVVGVAISNWASYGGETTIVTGNSFLDTGKIVLELPGRYSSAAMTATGNYWGTTDSALIQSRISDKTTDLSSHGYIAFLPVLTQPAPETPAFP